ncbi:hypothetical protein E0W57_12580 [Neisseria meningitidis]|nr:hypothetical protein [Neisseria meningitidis]
MGKIRRYLGRKQPKTCVWVSAVGRERNFAKVSNSTEPIHLVLKHQVNRFRAICTACGFVALS